MLFGTSSLHPTVDAICICLSIYWLMFKLWACRWVLASVATVNVDERKWLIFFFFKEYVKKKTNLGPTAIMSGLNLFEWVSYNEVKVG